VSIFSYRSFVKSISIIKVTVNPIDVHAVVSVY